MFFYDPTYLIVSLIVVAMLGMASRNVRRTFDRYDQSPNRQGLAGWQAARRILDLNGLQDVAVEKVEGDLTDHYDPQAKVLRLSDRVYNNRTISAIGVAAHETGHALQDKAGYYALQMRQGFYPLANLGSSLGYILIMIGLLAGFATQSFHLAWIGVALYACAVLLTMITLPVEFNASSRALASLSQYGMVTREEHDDTRRVLNAAALTYVAAAVGAILQLLYWIMMISGNQEE
ncbi:MAG: zinc metallopeptidase [Candidatus Omnitrophota bacterium]|jgi:Zn-dependent membrane protease YugP|nr:MAG: zinc metallopeptidase [Candidatus Omnitrophota bacterium]